MCQCKTYLNLFTQSTSRHFLASINVLELRSCMTQKKSHGSGSTFTCVWEWAVRYESRKKITFINIGAYLISSQEYLHLLMEAKIILSVFLEIHCETFARKHI